MAEGEPRARNRAIQLFLGGVGTLREGRRGRRVQNVEETRAALSLAIDRVGKLVFEVGNVLKGFEFTRHGGGSLTLRVVCDERILLAAT